jgi:hypothetical protein
LCEYIFGRGEVIGMQHCGKAEDMYFQKEKTYRIGSQLFSIKREYCGNRKLEDVISDMILKKEIHKK